MANVRPVFGGEIEVALGQIDLTQNLIFQESTYPAIVGAFTVITCTRDLRVHPPGNQHKPLSNGYNPAAQLIPAIGTLGSLGFEGADKAGEDVLIGFNGKLCVARLIAKVDSVAVRTVYCSYFTPSLDYHGPEGDQVATVSGQGPFVLFTNP